MGISIYRTDLSGDIAIESDGTTYNIIRVSPFVYTGAAAAQAPNQPSGEETTVAESTGDYQFLGSKNSEVFHYPACGYAKKIKGENMVYYSSYDDAISKGKRGCKVCKPSK